MTHFKRQLFLACLSAFALLGSLSVLSVKAADLVIAADGSGDFLKAQDAIDVVPENGFFGGARGVSRIASFTFKRKEDSVL